MSINSPKVGTAYLLSQTGAHAAMRFAEMLQAIGITPQHAGLIRMLGLNSGLNQKAVAELFRILPSRLVVLVDELDEKGLIERHSDPEDRRAKSLHLTKAGHACLHKIEAITTKLERELFQGMAAGDLRDLERILRILVERQRITHAVHPSYRAAARGEISGDEE